MLRRGGLLVLLMGLLCAPVRAQVNIVTTNPLAELPTGFEATAQALSNEWAKARLQRSGRVITDNLKSLRVMAATHPNDPDVKCWLGVANLLMAARVGNRFKYTKAATEAFSSVMGLDNDNVCFQCVLIVRMKEAGDLSQRGQLAATDEQCAMLPYVPGVPH